MTTVGDARRGLAQAFRAAGLDAPALDARLIVGHALGLDHAALAAAAETRLSLAELEFIDALAMRRMRREPVARILGAKEFWGLPLALAPEVLVPRPETETVVEAALAALGDDGSRARALRIADLGVGSGALLLALLSELPCAFGVGADIDEAASAIARHNAERLGLAARARFVVSDYGAALAGGFDLVVANPPYVCTHEIAGLAPEVRDFDPRAALDGGLDGLAGYRAIAADARRLLRLGATIVVETGAGQADAVAGLLASAGLTADRAARRDLAGVARAVTARRLT